MSKDEFSRVVFRYEIAEHPELNEWLGNQGNRTQSIIYALETLIGQTSPSTDIINNALEQTKKKSIQKHGQLKRVSYSEQDQLVDTDRHEREGVDE